VSRELDDLVQRVKAGTAAPDEVDAVARRLLHLDTFEDAHDLLAVLMFAEDPRHRAAVERYLDFRDDLQLARFALSTLCTYWGLTAEYVEWVVWYGRGVHWDFHYYPVVRGLAFSIAGWHLRETRCRPLLEMLVTVAADESEQLVNVSKAASALLVASGVHPGRIPYRLPPDDPGFRPLLEAARERLRSEQPHRPLRGSPARRPPAIPDVPDYAEPYVPAEELWSEVVHRARGGQLPQARLDAIAAPTPGELGPERAREQLLVLLFAGHPQNRWHREAVERHLEHPGDPDATRLALAIVCAVWGTAAEQVPALARFLRGVDWDLREGRSLVREAAFAIAGGYLARRRSRTLLQLLVGIAEDGGEEDDARQAAARALHIAYGGPLCGIPAELSPGGEHFEWALMTSRERLSTE